MAEFVMQGVSVFVTVQLPDELYQKLAALARAEQVSVSVLAGRIITEYVERLDDGGDS
jgi:predicted transcriptional regulator